MKLQAMKSSARSNPSKERVQLWVSILTTAFLFPLIPCVVSAHDVTDVHVLILDNTTNTFEKSDLDLITHQCGNESGKVNGTGNYQRCWIIISELNHNGSWNPVSESCTLNGSSLNVKKTDMTFSVTLNKASLSKNIKLRISQGYPSQLRPWDNETWNNETVIDLTVNNICGNESQYSEKSCGGWPPETFLLDVTQSGRHTCVTCANPFHKPETNISAPSLANTPSGVIDAGKASEAMNNVSRLVDAMGNATVAAVTMGNVKGVLAKIQKGKESNVIFGYSPTSDISISEKNDSVDAITRSVKMPQEASVQATGKNGSFIGMFRFPSMSKDIKGSLIMNDEVTGIKMGVDIFNLTDPIELEYRKVSTAGNVSCVSWNGQGHLPVWVEDGCETVKTNDTITCRCTHLTFFALLLSNPTDLSASDVSSLTFITNIGCGLSMFFLAIGLFMQCLLSRTKSSQATLLLVNLFVALFLLDLSFLVNGSVANLDLPWACVAMGAVMHYAMLATFTWFLLQAVHLYLQLWGASGHIQHYMVKMYVAGWVPSALVVVVLIIMKKYSTLLINTTSNDIKMCWITDTTVHYVVNVGYYAVVFVLTLAVFIVTVRQITLLRKQEVKGAGGGGGTTSPSSTLSVVGLLFLLGITWGFAFFSYGVLAVPSYYIFSFFNSFQGFFLFIYYYKTRRPGGEARRSAPNASSFTSEVTTASNVYDNNGPSKSQRNHYDNPYAFKTK